MVGDLIFLFIFVLKKIIKWWLINYIRLVFGVGFWTKELEVPFPGKMDIAIGIAQGLRYMHEQCPRGPIVHGNLRPCNILLGHNLQPQVDVSFITTKSAL